MNPAKIIILGLLGVLTFAQEENYIGCYKALESDKDSAILVFSLASGPTDCMEECQNRYFMYAGLMNEQQCYCMSSYGRNGPSKNCTIPCFTEPKSFCGSHDSMSVYTTGHYGPSPPRRLKAIQKQQTSFRLTWEPPDISNGIIISYTIRVLALETHASYPLLPTQSVVQGENSESTILTNLHPGTKYNISITVSNEKGESKPTWLVDWTQIGPPDIPETPKIINNTESTMTIEVRRGNSQNGPLSAYQIAVVYPGTVPPTNHSFSYSNYNVAISNNLPYYITAEIDAQDFDKNRVFIIGDARRIGGFYNAPLKKPFENPQIGLILVSRTREEVQYSYSDLTGSMIVSKRSTGGGGGGAGNKNAMTMVLIAAIAILGTLLLASVVAYFVIRHRHEQGKMTKLPEQQELTLQGPMYEVDNVGYIPEDIPERPNHYQNLKSKVWSIPKNFLNVDPSSFRRGRFGTVHTGTVQDKNGRLSSAIVHCISDQSLRASEKKNMLRELDVCIKAGTMKFLASHVGNCETPDTLYVVLEAPPQTLKNKLLAARSGENFPVDQILQIGSSIAMGLAYLEAHKIIHSHLCARSIGLTNDFVPKIMGYGIGKYSIEDIKMARWTAPERFGHKKHIPGVVWAFAVVIWEMMSMGGTPYSDLEDETDVEEAVVEKHIRLSQLRDMTDPLYEVLLSCWQIDYDERPGFDELARLNTLTVVPITAITEPYLAELELN